MLRQEVEKLVMLDTLVLDGNRIGLLASLAPLSVPLAPPVHARSLAASLAVSLKASLSASLAASRCLPHRLSRRTPSPPHSFSSIPALPSLLPSCLLPLPLFPHSSALPPPPSLLPPLLPSSLALADTHQPPVLLGCAGERACGVSNAREGGREVLARSRARISKHTSEEREGGSEGGSEGARDRGGQ